MGFSRFEIGFAFAFILLTYLNYLVFMLDWLTVRHKREYEPNKREGITTLFDNPNDSKPIWDRPTKPNIKNIWTGPEILEKPNAVKINENSNEEITTEEMRLQRLKRFEKKETPKPSKNSNTNQVAFNRKSDWN